MTHKLRRRFLFAATMLLMAVFVINTGPTPQAVVEETCGECIDNCDTWYDNCVAAGRPDCSIGRFRCYQTCVPVCNAR